MKFWKATMAMLLMSGLAIFPVGCGDDGETGGAENSGDSVNLEGLWNLTYAWSNGSPAESAPHVYLYGQQGGTCTVGGHNGTWSYEAGTFDMLLAGKGVVVFSGTLASETEITGLIQSSQNGPGAFVMRRIE